MTTDCHGITADNAGIVKLALARGFYQHIIAGYFHDNQGRVSEIKNGKRYADVPIANDLPLGFPDAA